MYGHDEHRGALAAIGQVASEVEHARERVRFIRRDLQDDDARLTADAREHLFAAKELLRRAAKACDEAVAALPTPIARPPIDFAALLREPRC